MSANVEELHKQMINLSLGDLLLLAGQAVNLPMSDDRLDIILKYVENAIYIRRMKRLRC